MCDSTYKVVGIDISNEETVLFEGTSAQCYEWIADNQSKLATHRFYIDNPVDRIKLRKSFSYVSSFKMCAFLEAKRLCPRSTPENCLKECCFYRSSDVKENTNEQLVYDWSKGIETKLGDEVKRKNDTGMRRRSSDRNNIEPSTGGQHA